MKAYTDLEQSKKLIKILTIESADMYWWSTSLRYYIEAMDDGDFNEEEGHVRAWSLAALFDILPKFIGDYGKCLYYDVGGYYCGYMDDGNFMLTIKEVNADNPVDACYEMILKLHEQKIL